MRPSYMAPCHITGRISIASFTDSIGGLPDRHSAYSPIERKRITRSKEAPTGGTHWGAPRCAHWRGPSRRRPRRRGTHHRRPALSLPHASFGRSSAHSRAPHGRLSTAPRPRVLVPVTVCGACGAVPLVLASLFVYHSGVLCATEQSCASRTPPMSSLFRSSALSKWIWVW